MVQWYFIHWWHSDTVLRITVGCAVKTYRIVRFIELTKYFPQGKTFHGMTYKLIQLCIFTKLRCVFELFNRSFTNSNTHHKVIITVDTEVVDVAWAWLGGVGSSPGHIPAHDIIKHGGTNQIYEKTPKSQCCSSVSRHLFGLTGDSMNNLLFAKSTWKCE